MLRLAIPLRRVQEKPEPKKPRRPYDGERAVEIWFATMIILILGMIVGIASYAVHSVIPELQKHETHGSPESRSVSNTQEIQ